MTPSILVFIKGDPTKSHKPAEAIRIALGLISGEHTVQIVLLGPSVQLLSEDAEDLVDGELLMKYLPSFAELGQKFYVEETAWKNANLEPVDYMIEPVSMHRVGKLVRKASHLVSF